MLMDVMHEKSGRAMTNGLFDDGFPSDGLRGQEVSKFILQLRIWLSARGNL